MEFFFPSGAHKRETGEASEEKEKPEKEKKGSIDMSLIGLGLRRRERKKNKRRNVSFSPVKVIGRDDDEEISARKGAQCCSTHNM